MHSKRANLCLFESFSGEHQTCNWKIKIKFNSALFDVEAWLLDLSEKKVENSHPTVFCLIFTELLCNFFEILKETSKTIWCIFYR